MNPRPLGSVGGLKGADFGVALQRQRDLVEAFEESCTTARVDLEAMHLSRGRSDRLLFQIDADATRALAVLDFHRERIDDLLVDHDRENSVLEAVGEEDIAEARADDGADSHFLERPHRAFPRRSASEVWAGDEN